MDSPCQVQLSSDHLPVELNTHLDNVNIWSEARKENSTIGAVGGCDCSVPHRRNIRVVQSDWLILKDVLVARIFAFQVVEVINQSSSG